MAVDAEALKGSTAGKKVLTDAAKHHIKIFLGAVGEATAAGPEPTNPSLMLPSVDPEEYSMVDLLASLTCPKMTFREPVVFSLSRPGLSDPVVCRMSGRNLLP